MNSPIIGSRRGFLTLLLAGASSRALAAGTTAPAPPTKPGYMNWLLPTTDEKFPQTDAEKTKGQAQGRALPQPEFLQPSLDPGLVPYQPTPSLKISRKFVAGCSDILPGVVERWVEAFRKHHAGFTLELAKPLAGSLGALELIKGNLDFVFVSRELKPTDISGFRDKFGYAPLSVPIMGGSYRHFGFLDALAVMVHPDNPIQRLSFAQLDAVMSVTRHRGHNAVKTWGDLGLGGAWSSRPVNVYGIAPWNGFEEFVRQRVLSVGARRGEWREDMHFDPVFFPVARRVAADVNAIGYTGLSVVDSAVKIVPLAESEEGPFISPTYEAVADARYPLSRVVYLNTNKKPDTSLDPALAEFLRFILSRDGQAVVREHGIFLPLRSGQVNASRALI